MCWHKRTIKAYNMHAIVDAIACAPSPCYSMCTRQSVFHTFTTISPKTGRGSLSLSGWTAPNGWFYRYGLCYETICDRRLRLTIDVTTSCVDLHRYGIGRFCLCRVVGGRQARCYKMVWYAILPQQRSGVWSVCFCVHNTYIYMQMLCWCY